MNITFKFLRPAPNNHANALTVNIQSGRVVPMPNGTLSLLLERFDGKQHALNMKPQEARTLALELLHLTTSISM